MIKVGTIVGDRYEILDKVGVGGMAEVFKGRDHKLNRFVAVKVLKEEFRGNGSFVKKFKEEAQAAAGLAHPNIVNVYDVGDENGIYYIVMELVEGITLKNYIERKGRLTIKEATSIAIQMSAGLEVAHNNQIVHRDIKPQNIIISREGKVKVTDFGIAKATTPQTTTSTAMGSVHYASPEQARGGYVDHRSDIYSLGIVLYEMVTGRVPFDGDTAVAVAVKHLQEEMAPPSAYCRDIPYSLEQIIRKCTEKSPDRRYQDIGDLLADLKQSLMNPDGDFVQMVDLDERAKTVIMSKGNTSKAKAARKVRYVEEEDDEEDDDEYEYEDEEDDEEDDDDEELSPTVERVMTIAGAALAVIIVIILFLLVSNMLGLGKGKNADDMEEQQQEQQEDEDRDDEEGEGKVNSVSMPNLLGKTMTEAKIELENLGLTVKLKGSEHSDEYPAGQIISQSEESGERIKVGTEIEVVTAGAGSGSGSGSSSNTKPGTSSTQQPDTSAVEQATVPNVVNQTEANARTALEAAGLLVGSVSEKSSDTIAAGNVVSQSVSANTKVDKKTAVNLVISSGPNKVKVTDVIGHEMNRAKGELENAGFKVSIKEVNTEEMDKGLVVSTNPDRGTLVTPGSTVTMTVSKGPGDITIPEVSVNTTFDEAKKKLRDKGFTGDVIQSSEYSDSVGKGYVTRYSPRAGKSVNANGEVTVYVSLGPESEPEPDPTE